MRAKGADGVSIHFDVSGEGPPLLMLPGFGLDAGALADFAGRLGRRFTCVGIDQRGAGESDAPRGPYAIAALAADAAAVIEAAAAAPAFVMGHSMGGFTALALALDFPEAVRGLLLVSTAGSGDPARLGRSAEARAALDRRSGGPEEIARGNIAACLTPEFLRERRADFERFVAERLAHPARGRGLAGQRAAAEAFDATARLRDIRVRTAVVHGDADRVVGVECGRALAAAIPGAALHLLPGVGHMPFLEAPKKLAAIAEGFL
jgi:3-oxoadipate enol-lactonase